MPTDNLLTKRECEIMRLVEKGKLNKEIALELRIAENTVEQHLKAIFKKLGVRNRTEASFRFAPPERNDGKPL